MKKTFTRIMLLAVLLVSAVGAKADNWLYAEVSGTTVTIKCCDYSALPSGSPVFNSSNTWNSSFCETVTTAVIDESCQNFDKYSLTNLFRDCSVLETITGLENLNTSTVQSMDNMFSGCEKLTSLDLSSFNTSSVTNMQSMFSDCTLLSSVKVGSWNTAIVTNMSYVFYGCGSLTSLDLSGWNTALVQNMFFMFSNCSQLVSIYVGDDWSTESVTSSYMFYNCPAIVGEDGTTFNISNTTADYAHFNAGGYLRNNYLYDAEDNSAHLLAWDGKGFGAVKIKGRTLKAGHWNSLCLPFALTADLIAANLPDGTEVKTLDSYSNDGTTVTIGFADAAMISSNKPYIVFIPEGSDITDPVFRNVYISKGDLSYHGVTKGDATFIGNYYAPVDLSANTKNLFLQGDKFYYPNDVTTINNFRAYFILTTDVPTGGDARTIIDWGDGDTTGIVSMEDGVLVLDNVWYDLSGRKLNGQPTEKGIYIVNGKKVMVK